MTKICPKCQKKKSPDDFYKGLRNKDGLTTYCKKCIRQESKNAYWNNPEKYSLKAKEYRIHNYDKMKKTKLKYYNENKDRILMYGKTYRENNPEKIKEWNLKNKNKLKKYRANRYLKNKNHYRKVQKKYRIEHRDQINFRNRTRIQNNIRLRVDRNLRSRISNALKGSRKSDHTIDLLGCSIEFLKGWLEKQFSCGMTWENYSRNGWHVDHIWPCSNFDLTDPEQQKVCFHYTNLQPLWAIDNIKKGAKINV